MQNSIQSTAFLAFIGISLTIISAEAESYNQDFDGFANGTTNLQDGSVITGQAANIVEGRLQLTRDGEGLGFSSFSVPAMTDSSQGFRITFDYELYDGPGANDPADGFSVNYGNAALGDQGQAEEGMAGRPGVTENISFEIDTWRNGDTEQGVNISGITGGSDMGQLAFTNGVILNDGQRVEGTVEISWYPGTGASFTTTGLNTNANFTGVDTSGFTANDNHNFIISARVGGANQDLFIDNLVVTTETTVPINTGKLVISEFCARNDTVLEDEDLESSDWIEIYNGKDTSVNLAGYHLTDDTENFTKWQFPAVTIEANEHLIVFASGKNRRDPNKELHTNFSLAGASGHLAFIGPDGATILSQYSYEEQIEDISYGELGQDRTRGYFDVPTPGTSNRAPQSPVPPGEELKFDKPGGLFTGSTTLTILPVQSPTAVIRYTTNNSVPTSSSSIYRSPFNIRETTTIRARIFEPGQPPGEVKSRTLIELASDVVNFTSGLPILVADSNGVNIDDRNRSFRFTYNVVIDRDPADGFAHMTGNPDFTGRGAMHVRGQSSSGFPKKQYAWETWNNENEDKDVSILGMPSESDWIVHAPYSDKTLMRNVLTYNLARDLWGNQGGVRTRFVEFFFNTRRGTVSMSDYRGVYAIMEKIKIADGRIKAERLENDVTDPELIQGGYIFKKDKSPHSQPWSTAVERVPLDMHDPQRVSTTQLNYLKGYVNDFERALHGEDFESPELGYNAFIDVPSFIDNHLFVESFKEIDGYRISAYFVKPRYGKVRALPVWDYNLGLGNANYLGGENPRGWYYPQVGGSDYYWYQRLFKSAEFQLAYWDRFWELRRSTFSTQNLMDKIDFWDAELDLPNASGQSAVTRNFNKWRILGNYLWPNAGGYQSRRTHQAEVDWMKNWLRQRLDWMETQSRGTSSSSSDYALPPDFNQYGGNAEAGFELTVSDPNNWNRSTIFYTLDGSDPRVPGNSRGVVTTMFDETSACEVLVPSETNGGSDLSVSQWTNASAPPNAANWKKGTQGVGVERSPSGTYDPNIGVDVEEEMYRITPTVYIRIPFNVTEQNIEGITQLTLRVKYDDSFVAYLNGEESTRDTERSPADLTWESRATSSHSDAEAMTFIDFDMTPHIGQLRVGENMLAMHGLNAGENSSDALWRCELIATAGSGNSPSPDAIAYDGPIALDGGVEVKARTFGGSDWSPISRALFAVNTIPASDENIVVSELNYRPAPASENEIESGFQSRGDFEFIELMNINSTRSVNLEGVTFTEGIKFTFDNSLAPEALVLRPGQRLVIADNLGAFEFRHGNSGAIVAGSYGGNLSNDGEQITIVGSSRETIKDFVYNDVDPWPTAADGDGYTLTLIDPSSNPDHSEPTSWRASSSVGGSPGSDEGGSFNGDPNRDVDGDGQNAFLEYALGTDDSNASSMSAPSVRLQSLEVGGVGKEYIIFEFQKSSSANGVTYLIQTSSNLREWNEASDQFTLISATNNGDGSETILYRSNETFSSANNSAFYRLSVSN